MNKIVFFLIISILFSFQGISAEIIKIGCFEIKPHMYASETSKEPLGASVEYFKTIAAKMGYDVEWKGPLPFLRLIKYLQDGKLDGALLISKNNERTAYLYYPEFPYHQVQSIFVIRKDNPLEKIVSVNDVKGYTVGYFRGANQTGFIKNNMDKLKMEYLTGTGWVEQNLYKLLKKRIDAVYDLNSSTMLFEAKLLKIDDQIKILKLPEPPTAIYCVFSKKSEIGKTLLNKYNQVVSEYKPDYSDFIEKEFNRIEGK